MHRYLSLPSVSTDCAASMSDRSVVCPCGSGQREGDQVAHSDERRRIIQTIVETVQSYMYVLSDDMHTSHRWRREPCDSQSPKFALSPSLRSSS